jgi:hypothetical protein
MVACVSVIWLFAQLSLKNAKFLWMQFMNFSFVYILLYYVKTVPRLVFHNNSCFTVGSIALPESRAGMIFLFVNVQLIYLLWKYFSLFILGRFFAGSSD